MPLPKFCVATLTCNDRAALWTTISRFLERTDIPEGGLDWIIFAQGCSEGHLGIIRSLFDELARTKGVRLQLGVSEANLGCSRGFNRLWGLVWEGGYEAALILEDDWSLAGHARADWLITSLRAFGELEPKPDVIAFRHYSSDAEKWQFGWTRNLNYMCHKHRDNFNYAEKMKQTAPFEFSGTRFQQIPEFLYSANPHICRVAAYAENDVFPMVEFNDVNTVRGAWGLTRPEDVPNWGWAEAYAMESARDLYTLYYEDGIFTHQ